MKGLGSSVGVIFAMALGSNFRLVFGSSSLDWPNDINRLPIFFARGRLDFTDESFRVDDGDEGLSILGLETFASMLSISSSFSFCLSSCKNSCREKPLRIGASSSTSDFCSSSENWVRANFVGVSRS